MRKAGVFKAVATVGTTRLTQTKLSGSVIRLEQEIMRSNYIYIYKKVNFKR